MINVYENEAWLGKAPEIAEEQIAETVEADVIVVGGGLAGVAALRQAAELGAKVILFEKSRKIQARSGDFAVMDSKVADRWGRRSVDKVQMVNDLMHDMAYKASQNILRRWAEEAGEAFDWYLEGYPDVYVLKDTREAPPKSALCWIQPRRLPLPESFDNDKERFKCYQTTAWVRPTHIRVHRGNFEKAKATGNLVKAYFNAPVQKLLRAGGGPVEGVIAKDAQGRYIRAYAKKGVILATGDYMSNNQMLRRFCPGVANTPQLWTSFDDQKQPTNTGDGHRLGMWIGAKLQDEPHAPCAHHMGSVFGCNGFLLLNTRGLRFVNEDAPGQQLGSQVENLPDKTAWQFVDGNWREQIPNVYPSHGTVAYVEQGEGENGKYQGRLGTIDNIVTPELVEKALESGALLKADTLEELVEKTGLPKEAALESIRRYNEFCEQGRDGDYGKNPLRLFPVKQGPFYAAKFTPAIMIAIMGGLESDEEAHCYDLEGKQIPGLYVAGNVQGNRFCVDYPLTVPGMSHSIALVYGRIAGCNAAQGI